MDLRASASRSAKPIEQKVENTLPLQLASRWSLHNTISALKLRRTRLSELFRLDQWAYPDLLKANTNSALTAWQPSWMRHMDPDCSRGISKEEPDCYRSGIPW